jgi:hypothetical protein
MGQKEEGIGAWKKEWYGIAVSKGFYPYESQDLSEDLHDEWGFAPTPSPGRAIHTLFIERDPKQERNK